MKLEVVPYSIIKDLKILLIFIIRKIRLEKYLDESLFHSDINFFVKVDLLLIKFFSKL